MSLFLKTNLGKLFCGDCLEIMKNGSDKSIDCILCDLPFGITSNKWDCEIDLNLLWEQYLRVGKDNCIFALHSSQPFTSKLVCSNIELWKHEWVWIKNRGSNFANTVREPFKEHEAIQIFSRGKWIYNKQMQPRTGAGLDRVKYKFNPTSQSDNYNKFKEIKPVNVGELRVPSSWQKFNTEVGLHPTQKPLPLMEYLIKTYTNENDLILDNCAGSGTTLLAAENLNRRWIGIEKEEKYCEVIKKRFLDNNVVIL